MKFNRKFKAKFKIQTIHSEYMYTVSFLETENEDFEINNSVLYATFNRVYAGDVFECECMFVEDENYSYSLRLTDLPILIVPSTETELIKLSASQIQGVSKDTMQKIVDEFGIDFIDKVNNNPNLLNNVKIKDSQKDSIRTWCDNHRSLNFLLGNANLKNVEPREIIEIYKRYGSKAMDEINTNPYALFLYGLLSFNKTESIAKKDGIKENDPKRISAVIYNMIDIEENKGSMCIEEMVLFNNLLKNYGFSQAEISIGINYLISKGFLDKEEIKEITYYGKVNNIRAEGKIAKYLISVRDKMMYSLKEIDEAYKGNELNKQQKESAYGCLQNRFSILTGGPGTGKTYTIKRIIRTVKKINPEIKIKLLAPTGKAAARMIEMIGKEAQTIHSALDISEDDNLDGKEGIVLDSDLIIIDEASMIEEKLFAYFCNHINEKAQVILVGDIGQLPSIGAGDLLNQLSQIVPTFELTQICRQDKTSPIVTNAHHIRNREFDKIKFAEGEQSDFRFIETKDVVNEVVKQYEGYSLEVEPKDIMILSPQHNRKGTVEINNRIRELNKNEVVKSKNNISYKKGDRIIQLKNTKRLGIHNGDQGEVIGASEKGLWIKFDNIDEEMNITDFQNIDFSYAITVHKSQGSEADIVIMVFNKGHNFILSNKLIYTALTRTKNRFIGIGNKEAFFDGCKKEDFLRFSLIKKLYDEYSILAFEDEEC